MLVLLLTILQQRKALSVLLLTLLEQCKALSVLLQPFFPCNEFQGVGSPSAAIPFPLLNKCKALSVLQLTFFFHLSKDSQGVGSPSAIAAFTLSKRKRNVQAILLLTLLENCKALAVLQQSSFYPSEELQALEVILHTLLQQQGVGSPSATVLTFLNERKPLAVLPPAHLFTFLKKCKALPVLLLTLLEKCKRWQSFCFPF